MTVQTNDYRVTEALSCRCLSGWRRISHRHHHTCTQVVVDVIQSVLWWSSGFGLFAESDSFQFVLQVGKAKAAFGLRWLNEGKRPSGSP